MRHLKLYLKDPSNARFTLPYLMLGFYFEFVNGFNGFTEIAGIGRKQIAIYFFILAGITFINSVFSVEYSLCRHMPRRYIFKRWLAQKISGIILGLGLLTTLFGAVYIGIKLI